MIFVLALVPVSFAHAQIPTAERDALIALYNSTDGANWGNNTNWLGAMGTECTWNGVTCDGGHVQQLGLAHNELSGSIPAELENLSALRDDGGLGLEWNALHSVSRTMAMWGLCGVRHNHS